jgi:hypothetical protein
MNDNFSTLDDFREQMQAVESIFYPERRLAWQVFERTYQFRLLSEFDNGMDGFLEVLCKIRSPLARDTVLLSVLDPYPITFFYRKLDASKNLANLPHF